MNAKRILLSVISVLLLAGCSIMPEYSCPAAPASDRWPSALAYKKQAETHGALAADLSWRKYFTDEDLVTVIEAALRNNRDMRTAVLNVERVRMSRVQLPEFLPEVRRVDNGYREPVPSEILITDRAGTVEQYRAELGTNAWEIDFFQRIRSLSQSTLEDYLATEHARRCAQILLVSEVANAYLTLVADRENLQVARAKLITQKVAAESLVRLRHLGISVAPELYLRQVQVRGDAGRLEEAKFMEQVGRDKDTLNLLVGSSLPADWPHRTLSTLAPIQGLSAGSSSEVLLKCPDIVQAESLLTAANANNEAARAAFFPRIKLTTDLGTASSDLADLFAAGTGAWRYHVDVGVPIFKPRIWPGHRVATVEREVALARYKEAIQSAFREVAGILARKGMLRKKMQAHQFLVAAAEADYHLANARYINGNDHFFRVLDAQCSYYAAQQGLSSIRLADLTNQVRLYAALGGGAE